MLGHLQGFFSVLDILAEGGSRHAELIGGRGFDLRAAAAAGGGPGEAKASLNPAIRYRVCSKRGRSPESRSNIDRAFFGPLANRKHRR